VGQHRSASASRLLDLDGFEVLAAEVVGGEWQLTVQTTATVVGCQGCGMRAELHGRRTVKVRDLPLGGRPVVLWWRKRLWRCREPACGVRTWTEQAAAIRPRAVLTERARAEACRRVGKDAHAVAAVARDLGVGWATVMRAVAEHGRPLVDDAARLQGVTALGLARPASSRRPVWHRPGGSPGWSTWSAVGCWRWWPTAPGPRWPAGLVPGPLPG
jgi:transposase